MQLGQKMGIYRYRKSTYQLIPFLSFKLMKEGFLFISIFAVLLSIGLSSCDGTSEFSVKKELSEKDSLALLEDLLDTLLLEYHDQPYFQITKELKTTCGLMGAKPLKIHSESNWVFVSDSLEKTSIVNAVKYYYNRNLNHNDIYDFVLYSKLCKAHVEDNLKQLDHEISVIKKLQPVSYDILTFKKNEKEHWIDKGEVLKTLGAECAQFPHFMAKIYLDYHKKNKRYHATLKEILKAYYELRDAQSRHYFNASYIRIYRESLSDTSKVAARRLNALAHLYPVNVLDVQYSKKYLILPTLVEVPPPPGKGE